MLVAENVRVRYPNGALGVTDVSLSVQRGQIVAIFGSNGSGKTTTVRACSGFLRTEGARIIGGSVRIDGENIANLEPHDIVRRGVAFVPERRKIFPNMSVSENLFALGALPRRERRRQLTEKILDLFPALALRMKDLAGRLSGGQQQMLAISRAIMSEPSLLIIDEMTLGLHVSLHAPLFEAVKKIAGDGKAVLIVAESTAFALDVVDYCFVLRSGVLQDEGPATRFRHGDLLASGYVG
jgi:branched-chain amino acid transport system ATP-binding protein